MPGLFVPQGLVTACGTLQWCPKNLLNSSFPGPGKGLFPSCISLASLQCKRGGFWSDTPVLRCRMCGQRQYSEAIRLIFHRNQRRFLVQWTKHKTNHKDYHHGQCVLHLEGFISFSPRTLEVLGCDSPIMWIENQSMNLVTRTLVCY